MGDITNIGWTHHTQNFWIGCAKKSRGCRFCLAPETRVLYEDMTWRPIGDVKVGDVLLGFTENPGLGVNRTVERSVVEAVWRTTAPTVELTVGRRVVTASADHKWLVGQRPWWRETQKLSLDLPLRVLGDPDCAPDTASSDYRAGYVAGVTAGDGTMRWDASWRSDKLGFPQSYWRVAMNADDRPVLDRMSTYLAGFGVDVEVKHFDGGPRAKAMLKVETRRRANLAIISEILAERSALEWKAGWLAGIIDTDGSYAEGGSLRVCQKKNNDVLADVERFAADLGFAFKVEPEGFSSARFHGDMDARIRFLGRVLPALTRKCGGFYGQQMRAPSAPVTGVKRGPVRELVDIQTSTRTFVAEGICTHNCYAEKGTTRWNPGTDQWRKLGSRRVTSEANWRKPFKWNREAAALGEPTLVFASSYADMFEDHPDLPAPRARALQMPYVTPMVIWQYLTKRPENVASMVPWGDDWPVNVWIGASVENQRAADERLPLITALTGAKVRFLSVEPMVGPVDLGEYVNGLDWVIIGGESGPVSKVDRMDPDWARSLMEQCRRADVPVFFKQTGTVLARELGISGKGEDINELPPEFRVREFPPLVVAA